MQTWDPREFSEWLPPFNDESSTYHNLRLVYDAETQTLTGYVDEQNIGSLKAEINGKTKISLRVTSDMAGNEVDIRFDNFEVNLL